MIMNMKLSLFRRKRDDDDDHGSRVEMLRQIVAARSSQDLPEYTLTDFINIGNRDVGITERGPPAAGDVNPQHTL